MYLNMDQKNPNTVAAMDDSRQTVTYGDLAAFARQMRQALPERAVVFCLCENAIGAVAGYIGLMEAGAAPLLLGAGMDRELLESLVQTYAPSYFWYPDSLAGEFSHTRLFSGYGYTLAATGAPAYPLHKDLSLLLTTSGSTGSPKLVRHTTANLEANAKNIAAFFAITPEHRPMADLPMNYTMGLSVINSHLYAGCTVILSAKSLMSPEYWAFFKEAEVTTFTGVPYSFEVLDRLRFTRGDWPSLRILTQGGGKLQDKLYLKFAEYARDAGKAFIPTFGQTECSARMAYLPAEYALLRRGSIGKAIPEGQLFLIDADGEVLSGSAEGEMCYRGPNVTMGYAERREDLQKGDEWRGEVRTGDIARRDEDGFYYIVGRIKRFLKLYGNRVSLDQCEKLVQDAFNTPCACVGTDKKMTVFVTREGLEKQIPVFLGDKTGVLHTAFTVRVIESLPKSDAGKTLYRLLEEAAGITR